MSKSNTPPRVAYNLGAEFYDNWAWQNFWRKNERPFLLELAPKSGVLLDIGCGTGHLLASLDQRVNLVSIGIDLSEGMLQVAKKKTKSILLQASTERLPFSSNSFDFVICSRVLSHLENLEAALIEISRVAKESASIVITDIDPEHSYSETKIPIKKNSLYVNTYKHSADEIVNLANEHGLDLVLRKAISSESAAWLPQKNILKSIERHSEKKISFLIVFKKQNASNRNLKHK